MYNPQLETFLRVADAGSFNKAAEESFITPTAVIKQMNLLEKSLGVTLFVRTHRGLRLTKAGRSMYQDAKYIIQYCRDSVTRAKNAMQEDDSLIRIGLFPDDSGTASDGSLGGGSVSDCCKIVSAQADFAFLDPAYAMSVPRKQVISGAFDTLSHAMETYFGKPEENNLSDDINEAVMRSVIRNIRVLLQDAENYAARSELAWASAMAENGMLKIGKITDFQAYQIEHQLGAYTDCNHGAGLAVIHPVLYRHLYPAGVEALADFIREIGLPTTFAELGIPEDTDFRAIADSTNLTAGCCKKLTHDEIYQILLECR